MEESAFPPLGYIYPLFLLFNGIPFEGKIMKLSDKFRIELVNGGRGGGRKFVPTLESIIVRPSTPHHLVRLRMLVESALLDRSQGRSR